MSKILLPALRHTCCCCSQCITCTHVALSDQHRHRQAVTTGSSPQPAACKLSAGRTGHNCCRLTCDDHSDVLPHHPADCCSCACCCSCRHLPGALQVAQVVCCFTSTTEGSCSHPNTQHEAHTAADQG
jgi:hypothetical protein